VTATTGLTVGSLGSGSNAIITLANNASGSPRTIYYKASDATINFTGTGGTDQVTITNGGNVGIGTASPSQKLTLINGTFQIGGSSTFSDNVEIGRIGGDNNMGFATGGTERMRITSGGRLVVNTQGFGNFDHGFLNVSNQGTAAFAQFSGAGNPCLGAWNNADSGDNLFMRFFFNSGGGTAGSIDYNRAGGVTRYNTTSDANLKNIIGDSDKSKSVEILNTTKIREYSWKEDETNKPQIGVIAQELHDTFKGAVSVGSDDELLGTEDYQPWGVDKTAFTFHLIAGFQEHERIIKELQEQINQLKNQIK
jgi:hypothetical protein